MFDFLSRQLSTVFNSFMGTGKLTESNIGNALERIKTALIDADVPYNVAQVFIESVKRESLGQQVMRSVKPGEQFIKIVYDHLTQFLGGVVEGNFASRPGIYLVMGLQGSGKTTSLAKLAYQIMKLGCGKTGKPSILLASVDFYRPAALDQLEYLSRSVGCSYYRAKATCSRDAVKEILHEYQVEKYDYLLIDTAGRLHVDQAMLDELVAIKAEIKPQYALLVIDGMTGQESLAIARAFDERVGLDGAMITKMDSDTRAGVAFAFRYEIKKPICLLGTGEKIDDIELFKADRIAGRILGMGDVLSLVERAQEKVTKDKQEALMKSFSRGVFTLQDFADQMESIGKMGSLMQLVKYLPGVGQASITPEMVEQGELEMKKFRAIILSMTPKERLCPALLDGSRKRRIALGAGVEVTNVNQLLERFKESQQYAKLLKRFMR